MERKQADQYDLAGRRQQDGHRCAVGKEVGAPEIAEAAALVQGAIDPGGSIHASKEFQRHVAGVLTTRALTAANERARREH